MGFNLHELLLKEHSGPSTEVVLIRPCSGILFYRACGLKAPLTHHSWAFGGQL